MRKYVRQGLLPALVGAVLIIIFISLAHFGYFDITTNAPLDTPTDRVIFAARHLSLVLLTIVFCIHLVIGYRLGTPAMDPTYSVEWEGKVLEAKNVLTNNIEHGLVMIGTTLLTAIDLSPEKCAHLIPIMTWGYVLARLLFFVGYPHKRTTGVVLSNIIIIPSVWFNVYKLFCMYLRQSSDIPNKS